MDRSIEGPSLRPHSTQEYTSFRKMNDEIEVFQIIKMVCDERGE